MYVRVHVHMRVCIHQSEQMSQYRQTQHTELLIKNKTSCGFHLYHHYIQFMDLYTFHVQVIGISID